MPYKPLEEYEPIDKGTMDKKRYEGHHTICQFFRDMYHMTEDPEIKMKCRIGMSITKAMHDKLKEYATKVAEEEKKEDASGSI